MIVLERSAVETRGSKWTVSLFILAFALLFGGAAGDWFAADLAGESMIARSLQLSGGAVAMGILTAVFGSLIFGRNPVRWGVGMPLLVYLGGTLMAVLNGGEGGMALLYGAPLFLGLTFAAGVLSAFLIEGVFPVGQRN